MCLVCVIKEITVPRRFYYSINMVAVQVFCLLLALGYTAAFVFPYEQLYSEERYGPVHNVRFRRQTHHPRLPCCGDEIVNKEYQNDLTAFKECWEEVASQPPKGKSTSTATQQSDDYICVRLCMARKKGLTTADGKLDTEKVKPYLQDFLKGTLVEESTDEVTNDCLKEADEKASSYAVPCDAKPFLISNCVTYKVFETCPANQIRDKEKCDALIDQLKSGTFRHPRPRYSSGH